MSDEDSEIEEIANLKPCVKRQTSLSIDTLSVQSSHAFSYNSTQLVAQCFQELMQLFNFNLRNQRTVSSTVSSGDSISSAPCLTFPWTFKYVEKDVYVFEKPDLTRTGLVSIASIGLINCPVSTVWEAVTTPISRFVFDRTTKAYYTLEHLDRNTRVDHLIAEVPLCMMITKQYDLCMLTTHRKFNDRFMCCSTSVDYPECPIIKGIRREKLERGIFMTESYILPNGKMVTKVYYVFSMYLRNIPETVKAYVMKRQPLAIAYLRQHLEGQYISKSVLIKDMFYV